jgi:uncharacterized Zn finger protein
LPLARRQWENSVMGYYGYWYEPATPKKVKGGIKAQSKRGAFAQKWWGRRWIQTLESFRIDTRLSRGRSYARRGQVVSLEIEKGRVLGRVQGTQDEPYRVFVRLKAFSKKQWNQVIESLVEQPIFTAQLLGNEMPEDIETIFEEADLSLFPKKSKDLKTECSCPDWSNPCKHIAAVFYLMAEAFDNDPFLLFKLRGMDRDEFLELLQKGGTDETPAETKIVPEPLPLGMPLFWGEPQKYEPLPGVFPVDLHAALPKRLGYLPFWRSERDFIREMEVIYQNASCYAEVPPRKPA